MPGGGAIRAREGWCWGGFGLSWIWAIAMQWWLGAIIGFLVCGPAIMIWAGIKGHELALENRQFSSQREYDGVMDAWNKWGMIIFIAGVVINVLWIGAMVVMGGLAGVSGGSYGP